MSFLFENQGSISYLVYKIEETDSIDTMSLGMLTNNKIPGLIPTIYTQMDATKYLKYNISSKVSVRQFFEGQVNKKRLIGVFYGIVEAMMSAEDYMIDTDTIVLDLDYIFADVSTCESVLVCLPISEHSTSHNLGSFFKSIIYNTRFDQTENCDYVTQIINYLNSSPVFSLLEFKALLDRIKTDNSSFKSNDMRSFQQKQAVEQNKVIQQHGYQSTQPTQQQSVVKQENIGISQHGYQSTQPTQPTQQQSVASSEKMSTVTPQKQKKTEYSYLAPSIDTSTSNVSQSDVQNPVITPDGKKPTFLWLMMHFSKENKALYDASKKAQKSEKDNPSTGSGGIDVPGRQMNNGFEVPGRQMNNGFEVPGRQMNNGFEVPGRQTNNGFEVPGRQTDNSFIIPGQQASVPNSNSKPQNQVQPQQLSQSNYNQGTSQQTNNLSQSNSYISGSVSGKNVSFGDTTVLDGNKIGETTVLGESVHQSVQKPYLIRIRNNERIDINKSSFIIGKEKSFVDYFISDNTAISRSHAIILTKDGKYFIKDTNSTNHTYLNGGMIPSNVETPISHGTRIRLANEEFEFNLY